MIPAHTTNGHLPEGVHAATWSEFAERFGWTARRGRLLSGLAEALAHLAEAGCRQVFIGGSFVTTKAQPKDIDVAWSTEDVDVELVHPMFLDLQAGRTMTLALFGAEFFPADLIEADTMLTFVEFFQTTRDGQTVGIVVIDMETI